MTQIVMLNGVPTPVKMLKEVRAPNPVQPPAPVAGVSGGATAPSEIIAQFGPPVAVSKPIGPARISGGVIAGNRISFTPATYPLVAKMAHLAGTVVLRAIISKTGTIESVQVASATNVIFEDSAIDAVRRWQYRPYLLNGQPTEVDTTITMNYALNSPNKPAPQTLPMN
jgi:protein TonB